jgi:hypothetical protein
MKCAIMQPTYMPWLGYFELMSNCDVFIFLDDVQFVSKSWHNRNRIKALDGELLLVVPVLSKGYRFKNINEIMVNNSVNWRRKHLSTIQHAYKKAPFFNSYIDGLNSIYLKEYEKLLDLNLAIIEFFKKSIGIETPTILSSTINAEGVKSERIVNICKRLNADVLYDAQGAKEILDLDLFRNNRIEVIFQEYKHPVYKQLHGNFISHLSVLDLLFNEGDRSLDIMHSGVV